MPWQQSYSQAAHYQSQPSPIPTAAETGVGYGPAVLNRKGALPPGWSADPPPFSSRKNHSANSVPLVSYYITGPLEQPFQMRAYKTNPAYFLSKAIRGVTKDELGNILPFCKVLVKRTSDNVLIATTVSDANGNYNVIVPS